MKAFGQLVLSNYFLAWRKTFDYKSCTTRSEYIHYTVIDFLTNLIYDLFTYNKESIIYYLFQNLQLLVTFFISISLNVRRLRDMGRKRIVLNIVSQFVLVFFSIVSFSFVSPYIVPFFIVPLGVLFIPTYYVPSKNENCIN